MPSLEPVSEYLDADAAVDGAMAKEDSVLDASLELDEELLELRDEFNLPDDPDAWSFTFGQRLADLNASHGKEVREKLRLLSHNLRMIHARPSASSEDSSDERSTPDVPYGGAVNNLVSVIIRALQNADSVDRLLTKLDNLHVILESCNAISLPDRVFIRQTMPGVEACVRQIKADGDTVKIKFRKYKKYFYLLSDEAQLKQSLRTLRGRTISAERFEILGRSSFDKLREMRQARDDIVQNATDIGVQQALVWFALEDERVPLADYERALTEYNLLITVIRSQKSEHDLVMAYLAQMHELALTHPATIPIPGPANEEVKVCLAYDTFSEYEAIAKLCREMIQSSIPLITTLNQYIDELTKVTED